MKNLRETFRDMTPDEMREASREAEIAEWRETNRFCGRCGAEMKPHDDPGESLEDAIRREVREEASIEVKDIRYFGSQTWPFPSNIMIGFRAEYASGELKPDGEEVVESGWFDREHLPEIPRHGSIARAMLDAWIAEYQNQDIRLND